MTQIRVLIADDQQDIILIRGALPLGLPYTVARSALRRLVPLRWLASLHSLAAR